ncbi:DUF4231 domain-containing protein [Rufibacter aurantiacus]|uniref:DUF4231 domain-containing protein n=1 Tax=Rufibacter aurantiacus TaxID=2817374 RepID=UPI001B309EA8|nr:DUF4231 domain-containing protein [Rufibacter aurantiacus]
MTLVITNKDLPGLYQQSDAFSLKAQKRYVNLSRFILLFAILSSILSLLSTLLCSYDVKMSLRLVLVFVLAISTFFTFILRHSKLEQEWYKARSAAESAKTIAWKFMTHADPYMSIDGERKYLKDLHQLMSEAGVNIVPDASTAQRPITDNMRLVRSLDYFQRLNIYLQSRLLEQQQWYTKKAVWNNNKGEYWYWIVITLQVLALINSIALLLNPELPTSIISVLGTSAASAYGWLQLKQFKSLGQAYSSTANELLIIAELAKDVKNDKQLSDYIINAENAISREHTNWIAKRVK